MNKYKHDSTGSELIGASKSVKIAHLLENEIRSGVLGKGAPLASENALVKRFSVSRNTVRKSLEILSSRGLITTKSGIGSFVTFGGKTIDDRSGWSVALSSGETELGTRVLRLSRGAMDIPGAPDNLGSDFLSVDRLRFRLQTGEGVSLERSRIAWRDGLSEVLDEGLKKGSLTETLRSKGLVVASGDEWASVLPALSNEDAQLMGRKAGEPMLRLRRLTKAADDTVIEYVESTLDPVLFGLHMEF
ncbi:GntR family transcriptional regulator [Falsiruegeria mediterranea]|uniref:HTH-type transcriptional repressor YvoA n=1 Tax=Falsiruegeria mediterranea M17 TaxID=1200281 RepID=A0A2R8C9R7_9RHOB|nr:GntR family transcriptional regulator [Falsiruegeria mediterranea]SPJ29184.1 HTH-type transcriptional repressor YvoA [Falsiruegeria mediterranea M17]